MMTSGMQVNTKASVDEILIYDQEQKLQEYFIEFSEALNLSPRFAPSLKMLEECINLQTKIIFVSIFAPDLEDDSLGAISQKGLHIPIISITHFPSETLYKKMAQLGIFFCLHTPFKLVDIKNIYQKTIASLEDPPLAILELVSNLTGINLSEKNIKALKTRLIKRCKELKINSDEYYIHHLKSNINEELEHLIPKLTTHTTYFFRESSQLDFLYEYIYPKILKNERVNIWSAACSTGEEVYSIAMSIVNFLENNNLGLHHLRKIKIIGTDIDQNSIEFAKNGVYTEDQVYSIDKGPLDRFFDKGQGEFTGYYRVVDELHEICEFYTLNLINGVYPKKKFDLIFARHVLMYFDLETQKNILERIITKLDNNGHLCLSFSESSLGEMIKLKMVYSSVFSNSETVTKVDLRPKYRSSAKRVLIVDDSPFVVKKIHSILSADPRFVVVGKASNPVEAMAIMEDTKVDLMTLDINMPVMDGLTYLDTVVRENTDHPFVVMISSVDLSSAEKYIDLANLPSHEFMEKPDKKSWNTFGENLKEVCASLFKRNKIFKRLDFDLSQKKIAYNNKKSSKDLIIIGSSTGGVDALSYILPQLPADTPPIIIAQHMPRLFTSSLAKRLNESCLPEVVEASEEMFIEYGHVYICPGDKNTSVYISDDKLTFSIMDNKGQVYSPSINWLLNSVIYLKDQFNLYGIILTGMGDDGALGLKELHKEGGTTFAQDEATSVVYGMPKKAIEFGGVDKVCDLSNILGELFKHIDKKNLS